MRFPSLGKTFWRASRSEGGAVTVLVALILAPVLLGFLGLVVDLGNAMGHHRHLQLQADAAALAGAAELGNGTCSDANVVGRALQYSSVSAANTNNWSTATSYSPSYNAVNGGNIGSVYEAINSQTYLPTGNTAPSDTTSPTANPCSAQSLDVKVTETMNKWYLNAFGLNPAYLNAHARIDNRVIGAGFLPFAVQESAPQSVGAYFVDEATGTVLQGPVALTNNGPVGGAGQYASDALWSASSITVPATVKDIGVVLALSGAKNDYNCTDTLVICENQAPQSSSSDYLDHIQGYVTQPTPPVGTLTSPAVRQATLTAPSDGTGCSSAVGPDSYFSTASSSCNVVLTAKIDVGTNPNPSGMTVKASVGGSQYAMTYSTTAGAWSSGSLPISTGSGGNGIDLWVCSSSSCNKNNAAIISHVQAVFAATATTAPHLDGLKVSDSSTKVEQGAYPMCSTCTATLDIVADVSGSFRDAASASAPLDALNFGASNTSSTTGTVECPPGNNSASALAGDITTGCAGQYIINTSDSSCANGWPGPGTSPGGTNGSGPPADCVQTKNGLASGPVDTAIYNRFVNPTNGQKWYCQNNWSSFDPTKTNDGLPADDSRIVTVFVTPLGTFSGGGTSYFPIQDFATFYVMGWAGGSGGGNADPCTSDPAVPSSASTARFWGHFIRYTNPNAVAGTQACNVSGLGTCTLEMTQ